MTNVVKFIGMRKRRGEEMDQGEGRDREEETDRDPQEEEEHQRQRLGKRETEMERYSEEIVLNVKNWGTRDINVRNRRGNLKEIVLNVANWDIRDISVTNQKEKSSNHCILTNRMGDIILTGKSKISIKEKGIDLEVQAGKDF